MDEHYNPIILRIRKIEKPIIILFYRTHVQWGIKISIEKYEKKREEQQRNLHAVAQHTKWKNNILSVAWQNYILPSFECNWALSFKNISLQKFTRKRPKIATKWVTMATVTFLDLAPKNMQISTRLIVLTFLDPTKSHVICIGKCEAFNVFRVTSWSQIC